MNKILFFLLFSTNVFSQNVIKGNVSDSLGNKLSRASITFSKGGSILSFNLSDNEGRYKLKIYNSDLRLIINVSHIGFNDISKEVENTNQTINFVLQKSETFLPEIKVKVASEAIKKNGDTITYNPQTFTNNQDRVIGDIIKKLPGIDVNADGQISYNGKPISHYYINGLDMLESNYSLANNNLRPSDIDKIQILENHQDKLLLDSFEVGRSPALNLKLKQSAMNKLILTGSSSLGYDNRILKNVELNGIQFSKSIQFLHGLKLNNNGINISKDITEHQVSFNDFAGNQLFEKKENLIYVSKPQVPNLEEKSYLFNKSFLAYTNALFMLNKTTQIKYNLSYSNEKQDFLTNTSTTIFSPIDTIKIYENLSTFTTQNLLNGNFKFVKNAQKIHLSNNIKINLDLSCANAILFNGNNSTQQSKNPFYRFINDLVFYKKVKKTIFQFSSHATLNKSPQSLIVNSGEFPNFFNNSNAYTGLLQNATKQQFVFKNAISASSNLFKFQQKYKIVTEYFKANYSSNLLRENNNTFFEIGKLFSNNFSQTQFKLRPEIELSYYRNKFKIISSIPITSYSLRRSDKIHELNLHDYYIYTTPNLEVTKNIGNYYEMSLNLNLLRDFGNINQNTQGFILNDYRTITKNDTILPITKSKNIGANFSYRNVLKGIFGSLNTFYSQREDNIIYNQVYTDFLQTKKAIKLSNFSNIYSINITLGKYFSTLKSNASLNFNLFESTSSIYINQSLQPINSTSISISGKFLCKRISKIFLESNNTILVTKLNSDSKIISNNLINYKNVLSIYYFLSNSLTLTANITHFYSKNSNFNSQLYYFINTSASWKKKKYEVVFNINNLSNVNSFIQQKTYQNFYSESVYNLRPISALIQYNFRFN